MSSQRLGPVTLAPGYSPWNARSYLMAAMITVGMQFVFDNFGLGTWNLSTPAPPHEDPATLAKAASQIATGELDQVIAGL